jgi:DDE superfamily endonuclease
LGACGLAAGKKNAARWGAAIVFIDEAGFMMGPHRRRSWAPRGQTPVLHQRGRSRLKVSVIGALSISPGRHRVRAWFAFEPQASFDGSHILAFLQALLRSLRCPVVLVWDRLQAHRGQPVKGWLAANGHRIHAELLPAYAPELNPVELIWGYAKTNPLANFAPVTVDALLTQTKLAAQLIGSDQALLRSMLRHGPLSLRLK